MLEVNNLQVAYGESEIINQLSFSVAKAGNGGRHGPQRNGEDHADAGLIGLLRSKRGSIQLEGRELSRMRQFPPRRARGWPTCPKAGRFFPR